MVYIAKNYTNLMGKAGFSETALKNHFTLYQGYVNNTNKVMAILSNMLAEDNLGTPQYAELKRRLGFEFNGMRLHEYYFGNLGGNGVADKTGCLIQQIADNFGSYNAWLKDFKASGMMRGIGWVILYQDTSGGRLFNQWINEHEAGHPAGCQPILVMDVFEHAFLPDYGLKKASYIEAFLGNINWAAAESRLV